MQLTRRHGGRQHTRQPAERVEIRLLGAFEVTVGGVATPARGWQRRSAAALVKVLALAPGHRAHREHVMDLLWPDEPPCDVAPKLHKAAYFARRAAGRDDAVVLRNDVVHLFPGVDLYVDVAEFDSLSQRALADGDADVARAAIDTYGGELLPDDRYEEWATERRELLRLRHLNLLRLAGQWMTVSELDPTDEEAHVELMRSHVASGSPDTALLQFERLERVLDRELGVAPGPEARELRDGIAAGGEGERARLRMITASPPAATRRCPAVDDLRAELAELSRRQTALLGRLAIAESECAGVAS